MILVCVGWILVLSHLVSFVEAIVCVVLFLFFALLQVW
jgi:hypothetical protein